MSLTSDEIADKEFVVGLRGYDKEEVRTFLRTVSKEFGASDQSAPHANGGPTPAEPAPPQPSTQPDWSSLGADIGADIAAVLRTAHEQADALRSGAEAEAKATREKADEDAATTRSQADAHAEGTRAAAEQERNEAQSKLTTAQDEALGLVADAQARVEKMLETSKRRAKDEAEASVAHLTSQISELTSTRDIARSGLADLRIKLDETIAAAEADPPALAAEPSTDET